MSKKIKKVYYSALALSLLTIVGISGFSSNSIFGNLVAKANGYYLEIGEGSPLVQTWSNTMLLQDPNNWTEIVSIEGFSGGNLSPVAGTDPLTILADNPVGTKIIVPNETNPAISTADGVAEFEGPNSTVALKGSETATAPNLVIHLNTLIGCVGKGVIINYNVRDIDGSSRNSVTKVNTQYRIGGSGNYTNVPFANIPDATTGPNQATLISSLTAALPLSASGQPLVDIRIMTTNALGADEWVGIDDIRVECFQFTAATATIRGRVMMSNGRGIPRSRVTLNNATTGATMTVLTNGFGYYQFNDLPVGDFYTVSVSSKQHQFKENSQSLQLLEEMNGMDFIAFQ